MLELTRVRDKKGKYKHSSWHNFKKRKRGWREYAIHPITVSVFGLVAYVGIHTAYAMNDMKSLDGRVEIIREPTDQSSLRGTAIGKESTGELAQANSDSIPRESSEGGKDINIPVPSSEVEEKILKAWEGTKDGHIAIKVFGCESGYNPETIGDKALAFEHNGQMYGRSIGIAQIRTGGIERNGKIWVASDNVAEFEEKMKNPDENLKMARAKYDASLKTNGNGWYPWKNCAKRVGLIQE